MCLGLFFLFTASTSARVETESFTIGPLVTETAVTLHLNSGDEVEGYFTVIGGNNDIDFYIKDPYGNYIYPRSRVRGRFDFKFIAGTTGDYRVYFDKSFAPHVTKTVNLTTKIVPTAFRIPLWAILILLGLLMVIIGSILALKRRKIVAGELPPPPPPPPP
jgi:hypothetical protein